MSEMNVCVCVGHQGSNYILNGHFISEEKGRGEIRKKTGEEVLKVFFSDSTWEPRHLNAGGPMINACRETNQKEISKVKRQLKRTDDASDVETLLVENARIWLGKLKAEEVVLLLGS